MMRDGDRDDETISDATDELRRERDEARANARILAHSYQRGSHPPAAVVAVSLAYPVRPEDVADAIKDGR